MRVQLIRREQGKNSTLSHLYLHGDFVCYILEDSIRTEKITERTCIPEGCYILGLNPWAGMNGKYRPRIGETHEGMIEIRGIPNFSLVFIHMGNTHRDTAGCLLTGCYYRFIDGDYEVLQSAQAYKRVYPMLLQLMKQQTVELEVINKVSH